MKKLAKIIGIILAILIVLGIGLFILLNKTIFMKHPELSGNPETGKWYDITPQDAKSSDGSSWHGLFNLGKNKNKVIVEASPVPMDVEYAKDIVKSSNIRKEKKNARI